jgi:membrane associated rhomboid family serine protease
VVSVLAGSAGALLAQPNVPAGGASGGVFGLAAAATIVMQRRGISFWQTGFGPLILINLFLNLFMTNVSLAAHLGGLVGGALATEAMILGRKANQVWLGYAGAVAVGVVSFAICLGAAAR